jgi:hypothetical protein
MEHGASFDPFDRLRAGKLRTGRAWGKTTGRFDRNGEAEVDENSKLQITNKK